MTEDEAKKALFQVHYDYIMNTPKERDEIYDEYIAKRNYIKKELMRLMKEKKNTEESEKHK